MTEKNKDFGPRPGEVRDGSCARLAIQPGESRPGWETDAAGQTVVHSDPSEVVPRATKRS
ncbi:MAG TPA: hypothetical protein VHD38_02330 [Candidatus Paceibacterota bacterium]|nr:hypothetical protein [Candidatus Paceibacterota bacterium]